MEKKIALVTGGNKGIGLEVVQLLAQKKMLVYLGCRDLTRGQKAWSALPEELKKQVRVVELNVAQESSVKQAYDQIKDEVDHLDILINNAGINYDHWNRPTTADLNNCKETFETNFWGAWRTIQAFVPLIKKSNHGRIVNVSSGLGSISEMGASAPGYGISKAALNALTKVFSSELKPHNILVNSVCPGWCATDMGGSGGRDPQLGAKSVLFAVDLSDDGPTGSFFRDGVKLPW